MHDWPKPVLRSFFLSIASIIVLCVLLITFGVVDGLYETQGRVFWSIFGVIVVINALFYPAAWKARRWNKN